MTSLQPVLYDARGNRYFVASPDQIPDCGPNVKVAAASHGHWTTGAVAALCHPGGESDAISDGLIVGPFEDVPPFNVLIVNTDGSLAERSGNGLTIFAQALRDVGMVSLGERFDVCVHHATPDQPSPVSTTLGVTEAHEDAGVWVAMGEPEFGPIAVAASRSIAATTTPRRDTVHVAELAAVNPRWTDSVLVRVGNPHCVTWVRDVDELPAFDALGEAPWFDRLKAIAFIPDDAESAAACAMGPAFAHGINLQWAARVADDHIAARIFERGEGPTRSSGSSATAVACAARQLGLVTADVVRVEMPGGTATLRFEQKGETFEAHYLGIAERVGS